MFCGFFLWAKILMRLPVHTISCVCIVLMCAHCTSTTFATNHYRRHGTEKRWWYKFWDFHISSGKSGLRLILEMNNLEHITNLKLSRYFTHTTNVHNITLSMKMCVHCACVRTPMPINRYQQLDLNETWTEYGRLVLYHFLTQGGKGGVVASIRIYIYVCMCMN